MFAVCTIPALSATKLQFIEAVNCKYPASVSVVITMYPGEETRRPRPALLKEDVAYLLEKTTFDEYDVREWFREFIKVQYSTVQYSTVQYDVREWLREFIKARQTLTRKLAFTYFHCRTVRTECSPRRRYFALVDYDYKSFLAITFETLLNCNNIEFLIKLFTITVSSGHPDLQHPRNDLYRRPRE